jgi:exopolysaccharide biosynthesis protein
MLWVGSVFGCKQKIQSLTEHDVKVLESLDLRQLRIDSLFDSNQIISILTIHKNKLNQLDLKFAYHVSDLIPTSTFARQEQALAAINGGFFDIIKGGSITYFEVEDSIVGSTNARDIFNGAIVLDIENHLVLEPAKADEFYKNSSQEEAVLVTGPLLLQGSQLVDLPLRDIVIDRHPRTCLCLTKEEVLFVVIDGRSKQAAGMTLAETQLFLLHQGCIDAINLDGGGSTTLWTKDKGIVNNPSDITGERPVANALIITH